MAASEQIDLFWTETLARAAREPLDVCVEPADVRAPFLQWKVGYRSLGGVSIAAHLAAPVMPEGSQEHLPAIVTMPGYGGWEFGQTLSECQRGFLMLQVYPRMQGESGPTPEGPGPLLRGIEQPEGYFYQGAYVDVIRGIDYLVSRPDVDAGRIGIIGTSQGGGMALAVAGLDSRIKAVVAHVPFFCDMRHNEAFRKSELAAPANLETFDYFDPVNLAPRISAPVLLSSGGRDTTCPPATIRAVFDRLPGRKSLFHDPDLTHTSSSDFYRMSWAWMDQYL